MRTLEIKLENPIGYAEIQRLLMLLSKAPNREYLIIDTGAHDFESIAVIKYFKEQLLRLEPSLFGFRKVAFIHPPAYRNESVHPDRYNFFNSKTEAEEWFHK